MKELLSKKEIQQIKQACHVSQNQENLTITQRDISASPKEKIRLWLCIVLGKKMHASELHTGELLMLSEQLKMNTSSQAICAAYVGDIPLFNAILSSLESEARAPFMIQMIYPLLEVACSMGETRLIHHLIGFIPDSIKQTSLLVHKLQPSFQAAATYGHQEILELLIEKVPDKVEEMIASDKFAAFRWRQ